MGNPMKRIRKGFREAMILSKSLKKTVYANIQKYTIVHIKFGDKYICQMK